MASNIPGIDARVTKLEETNIPIGGIIAFSGTFGGTNKRFPIPQGSKTPNTNWCLCDGIATNGLPVPDLRGRMILGASESRPAGESGGSETHTHSLSGTVGATTLTTAQMPSHNHGVGSKGYFSSGSAREPRHPRASNECVSTYNGSSQEHAHAFSASAVTAENLPPYYALAYIMRCA